MKCNGLKPLGRIFLLITRAPTRNYCDSNDKHSGSTAQMHLPETFRHRKKAMQMHKMQCV